MLLLYQQKKIMFTHRTLSIYHSYLPSRSAHNNSLISLSLKQLSIRKHQISCQLRSSAYHETSQKSLRFSQRSNVREKCISPHNFTKQSVSSTVYNPTPLSSTVYSTPVSSTVFPASGSSTVYDPTPVSSTVYPTLLSSKPFLLTTLAQRNSDDSQKTDHENERHQNTTSRIYSSVFKCFIGFLATVGLYKTLKTERDSFIQARLLPVAACLSRDPNPALPVKQEANSAHQVQPPGKAGVGCVCLREDCESKSKPGRISFAAAVEKAQELCKKRKDEVGSPGIVICVSVDGKQVYAEGFGYLDLENQLPMKPNTVLRIASISKAITATIVAKMWEKGHIDIEKTVQHYVPSFPQKEFLGQKVEITVQQLLNHTSGIRHYKTKDDPAFAFDQTIADLAGKFHQASLQPFYKMGPQQEKKPASDLRKEDGNQKRKVKKLEVSEMERAEYYLTKHFTTTDEALTLFASDQLVANPGTKYVYTTFGYTLLAAVVEAASKKPFTQVVLQTFKQLGLKDTYLDQNKPVIYNRSRYYIKDANGHVVNAPHVDNSYKWAGGGILSTAEDVVKFGNILLYSAQHKGGDAGLPGFLKSSTVWKFWSTEGLKGGSPTYALGFSVYPESERFGMCEHRSFGAGHTGAAVGASSALYILPRQSTSQTAISDKGGNSPNPVRRNESNFHTREGTISAIDSHPASCTASQSSTKPTKDDHVRSTKETTSDQSGQLPQGVVVCIMLNMISVSARDIAEEIARIFENVDFI